MTMQDYKFRQTSKPAPLRRPKRGSLLIRALIVVLSIGVLSLIAMSLRDLWPGGAFAPGAQDPAELIPLPLPENPEAPAK